MIWRAHATSLAFFAIQVDGVTASVAAACTAFAALYGVYLKAYEGSFKQQLDDANRKIASNTRQIGEIVADRDFWKAEAESLRIKMADRDRVIDDRDKAIASRDMVINEQMRVNQRISADVADLAEAFLIRKGDARGRSVGP